MPHKEIKKKYEAPHKSALHNLEIIKNEDPLIPCKWHQTIN